MHFQLCLYTLFRARSLLRDAVREALDGPEGMEMDIW